MAEPSRFEVCRWAPSADKAEMEKFLAAHPSSIASDLYGAPVFMATSAFNLRYEQERRPKIAFADVKDIRRRRPDERGWRASCSGQRQSA